ncbi:hypothetical protein DFQ27_005434 [Actinomortierella ambigua]|uniref:Uncharacterized protein n=1 Tax=Actinomortierella ambigua TaxID=1343610 RepID=A0A9P6Q2B9_9FUNG|nr:hypothetical protein DFQ27_005434 [Actinomortierella ambigua]
MLLLVPSNKSEDREGDSSGGGGLGGSGTSGAKVLVVLPPDTDLTSKNVLLPDIPKTPQEIDGSPSHRHHHHRHQRRRSSAPFSQDHLGIFQPTVDPNRSRSRHSSLDTGFGTTEFSSSFSSSVRHHPFRHHTSQSRPPRTPRSLRSAFRKFRPDPSPLLAPDLFGIDDLVDDDVYDGELMQSLRERQIASHFSHTSTKTSSGYSSSQTSLTTSSTPSLTSGTNKSSPSTFSISSSFATQSTTMGPPPANSKGTTSSPSAKAATPLKTGTKTMSKARVGAIASGDDTESLEEEEDDEEEEKEKEEKVGHGFLGTNRKPEKEGMDVDDNGPHPQQQQQQQQQRQGMEMRQEESSTNSQGDTTTTPATATTTTTLESDLSNLLGMASDIDLVMPKFDDAYLAELNETSNRSALSRRASSARRSFEREHSAGAALSVVQAERTSSQSSSTTITSIPTLRSRTVSPCIDRPGPSSPDSGTHTVTIVSPGPVSDGSVQGSHAATSTLREEVKLDKDVEDANGSKVDALTISRDIDNLKRHRDSLKDMEEKVKESDLKDPTSTKPSGPIYFWPSAHIMPVGSRESPSGPPPTLPHPLQHPSLSTAAAAAPRGLHPRPAPMIIQSSQWRSTSGGGAVMSAVEPGSNMIFSIRDATVGGGGRGVMAPAGMAGIPRVPLGASMVPGVHPFAPLMIVPTPSSSAMDISSSSSSSSCATGVGTGAGASAGAGPPATQSPPPVTAQQISMATANMTIPSPLELQEEYHYKRDLKKKYYQQLRRTTSMFERSWMEAVNPTTKMTTATSTATTSTTTTVASSRRSSVMGATMPPAGLAPPPLLPLGAATTAAGVHPLQDVESLEKRPTISGQAGSSTGGGPLSGPSPVGRQPPTALAATASELPSHLASYYMPPSVFRTVAEVEAEVEAERRRREEELKESFFNLPSPTPSEVLQQQQQQQEKAVPLSPTLDTSKAKKEDAKAVNRDGLGIHSQQQQHRDVRMENASSSLSRNESVSVKTAISPPKMETSIHPLAKAPSGGEGSGMEWEKEPPSSLRPPIRPGMAPTAPDLEPRVHHPLSQGAVVVGTSPAVLASAMVMQQQAPHPVLQPPQQQQQLQHPPPSNPSNSQPPPLISRPPPPPLSSSPSPLSLLGRPLAPPLKSPADSSPLASPLRNLAVSNVAVGVCGVQSPQAHPTHAVEATVPGMFPSATVRTVAGSDTLAEAGVYPRIAQQQQQQQQPPPPPPQQQQQQQQRQPPSLPLPRLSSSTLSSSTSLSSSSSSPSSAIPVHPAAVERTHGGDASLPSYHPHHHHHYHHHHHPLLPLRPAPAQPPQLQLSPSQQQQQQEQQQQQQQKSSSTV